MFHPAVRRIKMEAEHSYVALINVYLNIHHIPEDSKLLSHYHSCFDFQQNGRSKKAIAYTF